MTPLELLQKMRALLENPERWCQVSRALDASGVEVDPCSPSARAWCLYGAMEACGGDSLWGEIKRLCQLDSLIVFNDVATHAEMIARLDAGIERAKAVLA